MMGNMNSAGLFCLTICSVFSQPTVVVKINLEKKVQVLDEKRFLSLGIDANLIRDRWQTFDFYSKRLLTLAKGLSPAYLRLAGTDSDRMIFDPHAKFDALYFEPNKNVDDDPPFPPTNFTMTGSDWDKINQFCRKVNWTIVFGLNGQLRSGNKWDPTNARELLSYSLKQGYHNNLHFELGNEPDLWPLQLHLQAISGKQLAEDFITLRKILDTEFGGVFKNSFIVGPDVASGNAELFLGSFLENVGDAIDAVTWHHYYGGAELKYFDNLTDPKLLDSYIEIEKTLMKVVAKSPNPKRKIWQGESGITYDNPKNGIEETFAAIYMLVDKLGLSAKYGLDVVIRQTFYGFWFALIDDNLDPTPAYWVARVYRQLVGNIVLDVDLDIKAEDPTPHKLRLYAHCTAKHAPGYKPGAVTLYGMNLYQNYITAYLKNITGQIDGYYIFPVGGDKLEGKYMQINLNGKMVMTSNDTLPDLPAPWSGPAESGFMISEHRFGFIVIRDAKALACM